MSLCLSPRDGDGDDAVAVAWQVVPTQYKTLFGELTFANQYAVNEKVVGLEQLRKNEAVSGLYIKDFQGIIFTYDFHPVRTACL